MQHQECNFFTLNFVTFKCFTGHVHVTNFFGDPDESLSEAYMPGSVQSCK